MKTLKNMGGRCACATAHAHLPPIEIKGGGIPTNGRNLKKFL
jgi:hypothetical protein